MAKLARCLGVCLAVCICCFLYIHFFISPIEQQNHNIQKISLDVAGHVGKHFERKGETILQANVKRLNPKPLFAVSLRRRTQT